MAIVKASNRLYTILPKNDGDILEVGPASTHSLVATFVFQFNPSIDWQGSIAVLARLTGIGAMVANLPFLPVPYRRVTINNVASDYAMVSDIIVLTAGTKIQVPANMDSIGLLVSCSAGACTYLCQDIQGPSSV